MTALEVHTYPIWMILAPRLAIPVVSLAQSTTSSLGSLTAASSPKPTPVPLLEKRDFESLP